MPSPIRAEVTVTVPVPAERLWPAVADTDRMDRAAGLPAVHYTRTTRPEGGERVVGSYRLGPVTYARWIEPPFEWEWPRRFAVRREYLSGPLLRFYGGTELQPDGAGTRLRSFVEITPRLALLTPIIRYGLIPGGLGRAARQHRQIAAFLQSQATATFPALLNLRTPVDQPRLNELVARLIESGGAPATAQRLRTVLADGADEDAVSLRPLALADAWQTSPDETLSTFLRATLTGLLTLRWELLCPSCRGVRASAETLATLATSAACPACNAHVVASRDEMIEARFYPAPAIRDIQLGSYCVGSPTRTPHRLAQVNLAPGATHDWRLTVAPGSYRLHAPQCAGTVELTAAEAMTATTATVTFGRESVTPQTLRLAEGAVTMTLVNASPHAITVALDDLRWSRLGATPGRLLRLPAFRQLFSAEALAPGVELAVGRVGLLFSDLAGSTALYQRVGDARAFRLVSEHFTLLRGAIEEAGGAVVKTIGDAVMGCFPDGRHAFQAGLAIQRAARQLALDDQLDPRRLIKIGIHVGPCYAVTMNDRLDYFGSAVNLAARAQHEANGGDIVATGAVIDECQADLARLSLVGQAESVLLRGFDEPLTLYRFSLADRPEARRQ